MTLVLEDGRTRWWLCRDDGDRKSSEFCERGTNGAQQRALGLCLACMVLLSALACGPTRLELRNEASAVAFHIGQTHKREVANALGLPSSRTVNAGREFWGYSKPRLSGLVVPVVIPAVGIVATDVLVPTPEQSESAVYVFDEDGTLIAAVGAP